MGVFVAVDRERGYDLIHPAVGGISAAADAAALLEAAAAPWWERNKAPAAFGPSSISRWPILVSENRWESEGKKIGDWLAKVSLCRNKHFILKMKWNVTHWKLPSPCCYVDGVLFLTDVAQTCPFSTPWRCSSFTFSLCSSLLFSSVVRWSISPSFLESDAQREVLWQMVHSGVGCCLHISVKRGKDQLYYYYYL